MTAEVARLADELATLVALTTAAHPDALARAREDALAASIVATLRLDGADPDLARGERAGTWFDAVGDVADPDGGVVSDHELARLEEAGVRAALDADDLAPALAAGSTTVEDAIARLATRLTDGLVTPERQGRHREGHRIVHDASVGRVLYFPLDPAHVADAMAALAAWVATTREPAVVVAGVVHLELLRIHPFDAAAGRLARAAARLALRAGGLDPARLTAVEPVLAEDALAHAEAVAATLRRRDLTLWLEGWAEVVADALRHARTDLRAILAGDAGPQGPGDGGGDGAAREDDGQRDALARRLATLHAERAGRVLTLAEHRDAAGITLARARDELDRAIDLGLVVRVRGSGGLRHRLVEQLLP